MRKKQLYAILLAGALAAGNVPYAVFAAEETAAFSETSDESTDATPAEQTENSAQQEDDAANGAVTEAPAEITQAPVEPTQAPADDSTAAETQNQSNAAPVPEQTETQESGGPEITTAPAEDTGISIETTSGTKYYQTLQEAVDAVTTTGEASTATVIKVTKMLSLSGTVNVSQKKVCITATVPDIEITRGDDGSGVFDGDLFSVTGSGSELQFAADDQCSLKINGDNRKGEDSPASGAIVNVGAGAAFGLKSGVTLTGNNSSAAGAAITNDGGSIVLQGGTITGNKGSKGAVYTNNDIAVQGTVAIKENTGANLYLDNNAAVVVTGAMTGSSVSLTAGSAGDQQQVLAAGKTEDGTEISAEDFETAVKQFTYDTQDFTIIMGEDGKSAVLKQASVTGTPTPSAAPTATPAPTAAPSATPAPTQKPSVTPTASPSFLTYQSGSLKWVDHSTISVGMSTTKDCKWYYFFVNADTSVSQIQQMYDASRAVNSAKANTSFTIKVENVPEEDSWLVVAAKPTSGNVQMRVLKLDSEWFKNKRPASSSTTTRAPKTHSVNESTVTGLEDPLKFYPSTFYEFQVTGAGQNDRAPYVTGDERWIPMYWSTSQNPSDSQKNTTWRIGSTSGITQAATYNMYIFFKKQAYNGSEWADTDVIEYIVTQFRSAEITDDELDNWKKENNVTTIPGQNDGAGSGGSAAELTATAAASEKDGGSSSKSAVSTADESPIGTMSALAVLSLAAGGYIIVRKRKKEDA